ncbi:hypothetical protein LOK49_LG06G02529 [Camellia lanceoleosa]|uniref:Uncharacterized protein n=1 Tax=Camellia lanceoleosa TaxID=1840588 RepID=A0ACC0HFU7_9ERIC|nr:hypothetical protein LOK49_LG06G02529 [Camellia lanceoleosa]
MDGRSFNPITSGRSGYAPFGYGYGMGLNFEPGLNPNLVLMEEGMGLNANLNNTLSYERPTEVDVVTGAIPLCLDEGMQILKP